MDDNKNLKERPHLPLDLDRELFRGVLDQDEKARNLRQHTPSGFAYSGAESHVLLAACQPNQKARELDESGKHHGRFTYHLLQCLRNDVANRAQPLTYAALVDMVAQRMDPKSGTIAGAGSVTDGPDVQQPHCEGRHRHRILFSTEEEARSDTFPLIYLSTPCNDVPKSSAGLFVEAGSAQGIGLDTRFVYRYRATSLDTHGGLYGYITLQPIAIGANRTSIGICGQSPVAPTSSKELLEDRLRRGKRATVSISTWGYKPMKVWYEQGVPARVGPGNGNVVRFTEVERSDEADICCQPNIGTTNGYTLKRCDPLIAHFEGAKPVIPLPNNTLVTKGASFFNGIAHFNFHLYNHNSIVKVRQDLAFDVQLHPLQRHDEGGIEMRYRPKEGSQDLLAQSTLHRVPEDTSLTYSVCGDEVREVLVTDVTETYGITVVNKSPILVDMFVYVFYFDPLNYEILVSFMSIPVSTPTNLGCSYDRTGTIPLTSAKHRCQRMGA